MLKSNNVRIFQSWYTLILFVLYTCVCVEVNQNSEHTKAIGLLEVGDKRRARDEGSHYFHHMTTR